MPYRTDLEWMGELGNFTDDEQKVLLALSKEGKDWRSKKKIHKVTGLDSPKVDEVLAGLFAKGYLRSSFSKRKNIIFGLKEIVS